MNQKPLSTRIIGIDYGLARMGLAVSDESKTIAAPFMIFQVEKKSEQTIAKLILELQKHQEKLQYQISEIVIGLPLMMSGKVGFLADEVKHFVEELKKHTSIPILTWDERLTSVQAERSMREGLLSRKKRAKNVDSVAAVIILQSYLDFKKIHP
jgi:putative Holliday junction resolvase